MKIESNQGSLKSQLSSKTVQVQASVSKLITFDSWKMKKKRPYEHDQPSVLIFDMTGLKVARHEKKCQKGFCWHQNIILVFSGPSPGLYTCIKPYKILHKIKHEGDPSELYNKWSEWKRLSTTILSLRDFLLLSRSQYSSIKSWKTVKSEVKVIFLRLV